MSATKKSKTTISMTKKVDWVVPNFSRGLFEKYKPGQSINSTSFTVHKRDVSTEWFLELYPNGLEEENKSNVSLYLCSKSAEEAKCIDFRVKFKLGIAKKGRKDDYVVAEMNPSKKLLENGYGYPEFLSHAELFDEEAGFIVDGTFTVFVDLEVEFEIETEKPQPEVSLIASVIGDYKKMFETEALSDFQLETNDGDVLKTHKFILAARSPVFYAMLTTDMEEQRKDSVKVPDFDSKIMREFLRFVYYSEVENLDDFAFDLIYAAEKYQIEALKKLCLQKIASMLGVENVINTLLLMNQISGADKLLEKCLDLIVSNFYTVRKSSSWKELSTALIEQIMDRMSELVCYSKI